MKYIFMIDHMFIPYFLVAFLEVLGELLRDVAAPD